MPGCLRTRSHHWAALWSKTLWNRGSRCHPFLDKQMLPLIPQMVKLQKRLKITRETYFLINHIQFSIPSFVPLALRLESRRVMVHVWGTDCSVYPSKVSEQGSSLEVVHQFYLPTVSHGKETTVINTSLKYLSMS